MRFIIYILFLLLIGYGNPTPKVTPNKLPNTVVDHPYSELIQISGDALNRKSVEIIMPPKNSGLEWKPKVPYQKWGSKVKKDKDLHNITIYGTPYKKGVITISVFHSSLETMYLGKKSTMFIKSR